MTTTLFYCSVLIYILKQTEYKGFEQERNRKVATEIFFITTFFKQVTFWKTIFLSLQNI